MGKLKLGLLSSVAIIALFGAASQVALAEPNEPAQMLVVLADRTAVSETEGGIDLVKSFLGLVSALREGALFTFANTDEPTEFLTPMAVESPQFRSFREGFESNLIPSAEQHDPDLLSTLAETYNLLGATGASSGSTVYLITGGDRYEDLTLLEDRLKPVIGLFQDQGWSIVGIGLPGSPPALIDFLDHISSSTGRDWVELSVPNGFKSLADQTLREQAKGSLTELNQGVLTANAVLTSTLGIAPGTSETTLFFFKEGSYGSLRLSNPAGFEASAGDRTASTVIETPNVVIWKLIDPTPGQWRVDMRGVEGTVSAWYHSTNKFSIVLESFGMVPLGEPAPLLAYVTDGRQKVVVDNVILTAEVTAPGGASLVHELNDEGRSGDSVAGDGFYAVTIPPLAEEGEYRVDLVLSWPEFDHHISSRAAFTTQSFPNIELTRLKTDELQPGERVRVATLAVNVEGQPYAISVDEITASMTSNIDQPGTLEIKPRQLIDRGRAWEYDLFFTPDGEGQHTVVLRLNLEYAGRQYVHNSNSIVLSSILPKVAVPPEPAAPVTPTAPAPEPRLAPATPVTGSSALRWVLLGISVAFAALLAAGALYWLTRTRPFGYLYDDRDELVVDFASIKHHPLMMLLFRNYVRGKDLAIAGFDGVWFHFSGERVRLDSRSATHTVRVNNQPVVGKAAIHDRTWIGAHGRLYSFLVSPPSTEMEPGLGDD